jgi:CRISPR-associated endonuclease/helicase Cas3
MEYEFSTKAKSIWAKKKAVDNQYYWLPLITHLWDTEQMINQLYNHWLSKNQREVLAEGMTEDVAQKVVKFLGAVHDLGKATPAFELKPSYTNTKSLDDETIERLENAGFHDLGNAHITDARHSPHAKAGEAILLRFKVPQSLTGIIGGHHGKPLETPPKKEIRNYTSNFWQTDHDQEKQAPWKAVQQELFDWCLAVSGFDNVQDLPQVSESQAVILEGLLIMADWLASSEFLDAAQSVPLFPLIHMDENFDDIDENFRWQHAWTVWNHDLSWQVHIDWSTDPYYERWQFHPRPVQDKVTKTIQAAVNPSLMILEAPMGLGKTEVALLAAEQLAFKDHQNGLFFGLPTQATTNAMFDRVLEWLKKQANIDQESLSVHLMHGRAIFNQSFQALPVAQSVDTDSDSKAPTVEVNDWFAGKKTILDEFTIGTIDHLLLMALKQKHLALRHLGLSKKVVILDEIHASDTYMDQYLFKALQWLGAYHVPVILLSATLPAAKRRDLVDAYYEGKYSYKLSQQTDVTLMPKNWQTTDAYPLLTLLDGPQLQQITDFPGASDQKQLVVKVTQIAEDDEALVEHVMSDLEAGGVAGIIVNTIARAQTINALLEAQQVPTFVLHSAFIATDRRQREKELQQQIGKGDHAS